MQVKRKVAILLTAGAALVSSGCAGISAAPSFSPLSLFLPGLVQNQTQTDTPVPGPVQPPVSPAERQAAPVVVAQVR